MRPPVLALALLLCAAAPVQAQEAAAGEPVVRTELEPASVLTGQPATLRVTVLVPTYFPRPVTLPSFDLPNVMVELPDEATRPVSERVEGRKWSGVRRVYRITPLVPGAISIPPQQIRFTYADASYQPVEATARTAALTLTGTVPEAAADLDPFLAAASLSLEQTIEGAGGQDSAGEVAGGDLEPGAAITRTVTVRVTGSKAMAIPPVLQPLGLPGLAEHPAAPEVADDAETGTGIRTERVTYIAGQGGRYVLPAITLGWYDIGADRVEEATLEGVELAVRGPAPAQSAPPRDWRVIAGYGAALLLLALGLRVAWRLAAPIAAARAGRARAAYRASPGYALRRADSAFRAHRLGAALAWTERWRRRRGEAAAGPGPVKSACLDLGRGLYGPEPAAGGAMETLWSEARRALKGHARRRPGRTQRSRGALPPLNP